jgi:predicted transglutaminase-like cysteine proteinase
MQHQKRDQNAPPAPESQTREKHGMFRHLGLTLQSTRLGDLLLSSGLISSAQLEQALSYQKFSQKPIGQTLIDLGCISPVQLYRKLAEQWCLKLSAAGLTFMLNTFVPMTSASADQAGNNIRLAAAFAPAAMRLEQLPAQKPLFGTTEIRSTDITPFTKWTAAIMRFETQVNLPSNSARVSAWKEKLQTLQGKTAAEQVAEVNDFMNNVRYIEDRDNYRKSDHWATPLEFMANGGDCEDYAIAKYASLRALGFSTEQLRILIVHDKIKNIAHAVLVVYTDAGAFVLDNQEKAALPASAVTRYKPIFSINSGAWWLHQDMRGA